MIYVSTVPFILFLFTFWLQKLMKINMAEIMEKERKAAKKAMRDFAEESLSKNASSYASKIVVDMATASSC